MAVVCAALILSVALHYIEKQLKRIADGIEASATADSPQGVNTNEPTEANTDGTSNIETGNEKRIDP